MFLSWRVKMKMKYSVNLITKDETHEWLLKIHYSHRIPNIIYSYGLFNTNNRLVGVCTYGMPPSNQLCRGICGVEYSNIVLELNRLCLLDNHEKNITSYFVSKTLNLLPKPKIIVSYADTSMKHIGIIYQATNFLYTGLTVARTEWAIKGMEHLHTKNISNGNTLSSLKKQHGTNFYYRDRSQKHRYVYFIGDKRFKKTMIKKLNYKIEQYPKGTSEKYDIDYVPSQQTRLF